MYPVNPVDNLTGGGVCSNATPPATSVIMHTADFRPPGTQNSQNVHPTQNFGVVDHRNQAHARQLPPFPGGAGYNIATGPVRDPGTFFANSTSFFESPQTAMVPPSVATVANIPPPQNLGVAQPGGGGRHHLPHHHHQLDRLVEPIDLTHSQQFESALADNRLEQYYYHELQPRQYATTKAVAPATSRDYQTFSTANRFTGAILSTGGEFGDNGAQNAEYHPATVAGNELREPFGQTSTTTSSANWGHHCHQSVPVPVANPPVATHHWNNSHTNTPPLHTPVSYELSLEGAQIHLQATGNNTQFSGKTTLVDSENRSVYPTYQVPYTLEESISTHNRINSMPANANSLPTSISGINSQAQNPIVKKRTYRKKKDNVDTNDTNPKPERKKRQYKRKTAPVPLPLDNIGASFVTEGNINPNLTGCETLNPVTERKKRPYKKRKPKTAQVVNTATLPEGTATGTGIQLMENIATTIIERFASASISVVNPSGVHPTGNSDCQQLSSVDLLSDMNKPQVKKRAYKKRGDKVSDSQTTPLTKPMAKNTTGRGRGRGRKNTGIEGSVKCDSQLSANTTIPSLSGINQGMMGAVPLVFDGGVKMVSYSTNKLSGLGTTSSLSFLTGGTVEEINSTKEVDTSNKSSKDNSSSTRQKRNYTRKTPSTRGRGGKRNSNSNRSLKPWVSESESDIPSHNDVMSSDSDRDFSARRRTTDGGSNVMHGMEQQFSPDITETQTINTFVDAGKSDLKLALKVPRENLEVSKVSKMGVRPVEENDTFRESETAKQDADSIQEFNRKKNRTSSSEIEHFGHEGASPRRTKKFGSRGTRSSPRNLQKEGFEQSDPDDENETRRTTRSRTLKLRRRKSSSATTSTTLTDVEESHSPNASCVGTGSFDHTELGINEIKEEPTSDHETDKPDEQTVLMSNLKIKEETTISGELIEQVQQVSIICKEETNGDQDQRNEENENHTRVSEEGNAEVRSENLNNKKYKLKKPIISLVKISKDTEKMLKLRKEAKESADQERLMLSSEVVPVINRKRGRGPNKVKPPMMNDSSTLGGEYKYVSCKHFRQVYSQDEKMRLYADQAFVMDLMDIDLEPENWFLWQIHDSEQCLRQFYPSKFANYQFFISSPIRWYFTSEDFKSQEFYNRFQPIPVIIANKRECFPESARLKSMMETTVQFPYIDKTFFFRMGKHVGKLHKTEVMRDVFMESLLVFNFIAFKPPLMDEILNRHPDDNIKLLLRKHIDAWGAISTVIFNLVRMAEAKCGFTAETLHILKTFANCVYTKKANRDVYCTACLPKNRLPHVQVSFNKDNSKLYDWCSLIEITDRQLVLPGEINWCKQCSTAAKKLHRLYHYRYCLMKLIRKNMANDAILFEKQNLTVTDRILFWLQNIDVSWRNTMFLDLQVTLAEVEEEFLERLPRPDIPTDQRT